MSTISGGPFPIDLTDLVLSVSNIPFLLTRVFPAWNPENVKVKPVSGGITNMLIKCTHLDKPNNCKQVVLVRTYGQNTGLIIDRDDEFKNHLMLNRLNLAPMIYARFNNGIVYGFLKGRSLTSDELSDPDLYPLIGQKLGYWHNVLIRAESSNVKLKINITNDIVYHCKSNLWDTLRHWVDIAPNFACIQDFVLENSQNTQTLKNSVSHSSKIDKSVKDILFNEIKWLHDTISSKSITVKSHCDLLSGNIVIPPKLDEIINNYKNENMKNHTNRSVDLPLIERYFSHDRLLKNVYTNITMSDMPSLPLNEINPISFIDYEYMLNAPRGFDIANHLQEWQGFNCDKLKILDPNKDNITLRKWCYSYLIGSGDIKCSDLKVVIDSHVDSLIDEIFFFYGVPGFYWGIWSCIQDKISNIDFDYGNYSVNRLQEYFNWKKKVLHRLDYESKK